MLPPRPAAPLQPFRRRWPASKSAVQSDSGASPALPDTGRLSSASSLPHTAGPWWSRREDSRSSASRAAAPGVHRASLPPLPRLARPPAHTTGNHRLTAVLDVDLLVLHQHPLLALDFSF